MKRRTNHGDYMAAGQIQNRASAHNPAPGGERVELQKLSEGIKILNRSSTYAATLNRFDTNLSKTFRDTFRDINSDLFPTPVSFFLFRQEA